MNRYTCFKIAAVFAFLAIMLGAFGAHGLRGVFDEHHLATFETGVRYQFYHAIALFIVGFLFEQNQKIHWLKFSSYFFVAGIIFFCGSLYILACNELADIPAFIGTFTPLGGLCFLLGWGCVLLAQFGTKRPLN